MAQVTLKDGREVEVPDSDTGLLDYYRGEGATIEDVAVQLQPPYVIVNGEVVQDGETLGTVLELTPYDPSAYTVPEVNDYLATASQGERERVLAAEHAGQARVGIVEGPHALFDPALHNVDEVAAYLARDDVDEAERMRVLDAEFNGENRKGIVGE